MKTIVATLVALMAMIGFATATPDMGQSMSYSMFGETAGATYSETGAFSLGDEDALNFGSIFCYDNEGGMGATTEFTLDDNFVGLSGSAGPHAGATIFPGGSEHGATDGGAAGQTNSGNGNNGYDNGHHGSATTPIVYDFTPYVLIHQNLDYLKDVTVPIDPRMHNDLYMDGGNMDVSTFMGSKLTGVELGMSALVDNGDLFSFHGFTTDAAFNPIASVELGAHDFNGIVSIKDKFSFTRATQHSTALYLFNSTL